MSFAAGFQVGFNATDGLKRRKMEEARAAQAAELHDLNMANARREAGRATREDQAFNELQAMSQDGYVSSKNGLSDASNQMAYAGNAGYGQGEAAVQEMAGDFQREAARFRQAAPAPEGAMPLPSYDGTAGVSSRAATERELNKGMRNVALARRDLSGYSQLLQQDQQLAVKDKKKSFFEKYNAMSNEDLVKDPDLRAMYNDNTDVKGSVGWDPKAKKFIVTDHDGSGSVEHLSRADLMAAALERFQMQNGMEEQAIASGVQRGERSYKRVREGVADNNAGQGLAHRMNNDDMRLDLARSEFDFNKGATNARLGMARQELGMRAQQMERADWQPEQYQDAEGNVRVYDVNRRGKAPDYRERTMPEGMRPYRASPELKVNPDGSVQRGSELWAPDPKAPQGYRRVEFGPSALDRALASDAGPTKGDYAINPRPLRPFTEADLAPPVNPDNLMRVAKRGLFSSGSSYVYRDPSTGKEYSVEEFNRLQQRAD